MNYKVLLECNSKNPQLIHAYRMYNTVEEILVWNNFDLLKETPVGYAASMLPLIFFIF